METPPSKKKLQTVHAEEALRLLGTGFDGLTEEEARSRLQQYGLNKLKEEKKKSVITLFLEQFKSILVIILIIAAIISGYLAIIEGEPLTDSYVILSVLILNAILGFIQEYRAEKAVEALKKLINPRSTVIRGGEERIIDSSELVPGDIVKLEAGDRVPADLRVVESFNLDVDEAILTGESLPVSKSCYPVPEFSDDQTCFIYMGTVLTSGRALTVVVYTGMSTVFGGIAGLVQSTSAEEPPINRKVETLGKQLGAISILLSLWIFITGSYIFMHPIEETLLTAISLAVSAIPEGLPAVLTITMALGVAAMAREKAIIKKLASVETLGSTTVICSDKTGTITKNEMTVRKIVLPYHLVDVTGSGYDPDGEFFHGDNVIEASNDESLNMSLRIGVQCNNASLIKEQNKWVISGDPTEGALVVAAVKAGLKKINNEEEKLLVEYSFDSNRKRMSVIYHNSSGLTSYIKGAPEELLKDSIYIKEGKNIREISKKDREYFTEMIQTMGQDALRVIGVAFKTFNYNQVSPTLEESEKNVIFVGLLGIIDPPREEVKEAIKLAKQAGIRPVMLTGDHVITAKAIATQVGILEHDHQNLVLVGDYINELSEEELDRIVEDIRVCARVSPEHKTRIAQALKKKGHIVAMTGDGVNDAPALKTADIGIAMGIKGTDVTKEAADMILEDDNFTTIVKAVEGGRRIYSNITKYVRLMLCANFDEFLLIFVTSSLGLPVPFLPIHVLWINLVTDGLPAIALGNDPGETGLMEQKPRNPKEGLLDRYWGFIGFSAVLAFLADFIPYYLVYYWTGDIAVARSVCVTSIVLFELVLAYQVRSETKHLFKQGLSAFTNNPGLLLAVISSFILQVGVLTFPPLQGIMKMAPMKIEYFILCVITSLSALIIVPGWLIPKTKDWTLSSK